MYDVTGNFSMHGVTKQVTLPMKKLGEGNGPYGKYRCGFFCQTTIKRSEFGMTNMVPNIGDEVAVTISFEGVRTAAGSGTAPAAGSGSGSGTGWVQVRRPHPLARVAAVLASSSSHWVRSSRWVFVSRGSVPCSVVPMCCGAALFRDCWAPQRLAVVWRVTGRAASAWRTALLVSYLAGHWALSARDLGATALLRAGDLEQGETSWAYDPRNFDFAAAIAKSYQPAEAIDWLPLLALLAAMAPDAIACVGKFGPAVGWLWRVALCCVLPWRLVYGSKYWPLSLGPGFDFDLGGWTNGEAAAWIGGIGAALVIAWQWMRFRAQELQRTEVLARSALAALVTFGGVITLIASGSLLYGQLLGVLTAASAGCGLGSMLFGTGRGPDAAAGPLVIALGTLLVAGLFYAELSLTSATLLLLAMALAVGWLPTVPKLSGRWQLAVRALVCVAVLAVPTVSAVRTLASQMPAADGEPESESAPNPYDMYSRYEVLSAAVCLGVPRHLSYPTDRQSASSSREQPYG